MPILSSCPLGYRNNKQVISAPHHWSPSTHWGFINRIIIIGIDWLYIIFSFSQTVIYFVTEQCRMHFSKHTANCIMGCCRKFAPAAKTAGDPVSYANETWYATLNTEMETGAVNWFTVNSSHSQLVTSSSQHQSTRHRVQNKVTKTL